MATQNSLVISLGGSMILSGGVNIKYLSDFCNILSKYKGVTFGIVAGGGRFAREYADAVRKLCHSEFEADEIAIMSTKQNAKLLISACNGKLNVFPEVIDTFSKAKEVAKDYDVLAMGGTIPGITTDADAVLLAEAIGARTVINLSNVDGVYNKDPKHNKDAKKYGLLSHADLVSLAKIKDDRKAGKHFVFDLVACKLAQRSNIEIHFISGRNLDDFKKCIEGKPHSGSVVKS